MQTKHVMFWLVLVAIASYGCPFSFSSSRRELLSNSIQFSLLSSSMVFSPAPGTAIESDDNADSSTGQLQPNNIPRTTPSPRFQRYPQKRYIAALGDPGSSNGTGADQWGLWRDDPGPRGVYLRNYESKLGAKTNGVAPAGWTFRIDDWWLEEHGLIMSNPEALPRKKVDKLTKDILPYKRYVVTGDREVSAILTVREDGNWELSKGTLYDVTHLPCRSARYTPIPTSEDAKFTTSSGKCTPSSGNQKLFPVRPGSIMPPVPGCNKQDYAVLFVLGEEI